MSAPDQATTHSQPMALGILTRDAPGFAELQEEVTLLFDEHHSRLLSYVRAFGITGHDGEEIVQEVFMALFCHLRGAKSRQNIRGWIFRVAHNLALKRRTANRRWLDRVGHRLRYGLGYGAEHRVHGRVNGRDAQAASFVSFESEASDLSLNPEEQLLLTQRQQRLLSVVDALAEQDRLCFCLRAEGLRYREISHVMGISLGSVCKSLTRSMTRLMRVDEMA